MKQTLPLVSILLVGLAVRMLLMPLQGHGDLLVFTRWTIYLAENGFVNLQHIPFSPLDNFPAYTFYLPILWVIGKLWTAYLPAAALFTASGRFVLKIPGVIGDVGLMYLLYRWGSSHGRAVANRAAAFIFLNPATIYVSAYWGQVDSLHTLAITAALVMILWGQSLPAVICVGLGLGFKPQSIAFVPFLVLTMFKNFSWRQIVRQATGIVIILTVAGTIIYMRTPWALVRQGPTKTLAAYPYLTSAAINIWAPIQAHAQTLIRDTTPAAGIPARVIGLGFFTLVIIGILLRVRLMTHSEEALLLAALATGFAFFLFPTQIHERYLYPVLAFFAMLASLRPRPYGWLFGFVSLGFLGNLLFVEPFLKWWQWTHIPAGPLMYAILAVFLGGFIFTVRQLRLARPPARPL